MYVHLPLLAILCITGCTGSSKPYPAVASEKPKIESELAFATLSKQAAAKLNIQTQAAKLREEHADLAVTGWIMASRA